MRALVLQKQRHGTECHRRRTQCSIVGKRYLDYFASAALLPGPLAWDCGSAKTVSGPESVLAMKGKRSHAIAANPQLPEMAVIQGEDPAQLARQAVAELGGIRRFISRADIVLVKPNIAWDRTPEQAANTNPAVVAEVVRQCWDAGAKKVIVTDVSCNEPRRCFSEVRHRRGRTPRRRRSNPSGSCQVQRCGPARQSSA